MFLFCNISLKTIGPVAVKLNI